MKTYKNILKDKAYPLERALYGINECEIISCKFQGKEDGESALKEASNFNVTDSLFDLRYPLWHCKNVTLNNCQLTSNCRAAIWYTEDIKIINSKFDGVKACRESQDISIEHCSISSIEFGWRCSNVKVKDTNLESEYLFLNSSKIVLDNVNFKGKYSFQYTNDVRITNSKLDTKDAFWHSNNVVVKNSIVKGEYLGWYSSNLTLDNCTIIGTQPLCYCKNLTLINCKMIDTDLSFEYSDINATITGDNLTIKNPKSGEIQVTNLKELILTKDSKYKCECKIIQK